MKIAFVFPGQGAQSVGMGKDLYDKYEEVREIYKKVSNILGIDIAKLTFDSTEEELSKTKNTQIAIFTMSLGILEILKKHNIEAEASVGLSLGEYTALMYSNAFDFETGVKIVEKRGEIMQENIPVGEWSMAGVLALSDEKVEEICKNLTKGFAVPANYNCPGQVVVSGDEAGIEEMAEIAKAEGAKKVSILKTKGPFHTSKLEEASIKLKAELEKIEIKTPEKKVYKNLDAMPYKETDDMVEILSKHVVNPVRFSKSIQNMVQDGFDTFVEIGPGKILTSLIKRIDREAKLININSVEGLEEGLKELEVRN